MRKCKEGFTETYVQFAGGEESASGVLHKWVALALLNAVLGRRCWIRCGHQKLYGNRYTLLIGPSGVGAKSQAVTTGRDLLKQAITCPEVFGQGVITGAAFLDRLAKLGTPIPDLPGEYYDASLFFCPDTIGEVTAAEPRLPQERGLIRHLADLYCCPETFPYPMTRRRQGTLRNVCVNLLATDTPTGLGEAVPEGPIGDKFLRSAIVIGASRPKTRSYEVNLPENVGELKEDLLFDLGEVGTLGGEFKVGDDAAQLIKDAAQEVEYLTNGPLGPYRQERPDHTLKLAMALSAAESDEHTVEARHVRRAQEELTAIESGMREALMAMQQGYV